MTTAAVVVVTLLLAGGLCAVCITKWAGPVRGGDLLQQEPAVAWDATSTAEIVEQAARTDAAIKAAGVTGIMACRGPRGTPAAELERLKAMEQLVNWTRENEAELKNSSPPSVPGPHG